jgi:hypothetical protein
MRISVFLFIISMAVIWYGIVPIAGAVFKRHKWRQFRERFDEIRLRPILNYSTYRRLEQEGETFRFIGGFESLTDGQTLWIQGESLTMPVSLTDAQTFLLPMQKGDELPDVFDPSEEEPEQIKWDRVSTLTEGARVFVGGELVFRDERWIFVSTRETPLLVIFYDGPDRSLTPRVIRGGRHRNEYWNEITPYSLAIGALCQILVALDYLYRPSFRLTVITSLIVLFIPLFPMIPPGILFTTIYRRLAWQARTFRAYRDLARLPRRYLAHPTEKAGLLKSTRLPGGEIYGMACGSYGTMQDEKIPLLIPRYAKKRNAGWFFFGALRGGSVPSEPDDPFATFGALPGEPGQLSKRYAITAYTLEVIAWIVLFMGLGLNIFFISLIRILLW